MCYSSRFVRNFYTGDSILVGCGHCPACLQSKANHRTSRIRFESSNPQYISLFFTLTYDRNSCPFIKKSDLFQKPDSLSLYREFKINHAGKRVYDIDVLERFSNIDYFGIYQKKLRSLSHRRNNIGIVYYPDLQDFFKRLRQNLCRHYDFKESFKYFACSEYGETTFRPHFHALLFIKSEWEKIFRSAICESWPYGDKDRLAKFIEIARDASSYVSSYVNCPGDFPLFLKANFSPKHSYSRYFGFSKKSFDLPQMLDAFQRRDLTYNTERVVQGVPLVTNLPYPKYVINRFFPLFKGYSRLAPDTIFDVISGSRSIRSCEKLVKPYRGIEVIDYSNDDISKISVRLNNAFNKFLEYFPEASPQFYARLHYDIWQLYKSQVMKNWYLDNLLNKIPRWRQYDNIYEVACGQVNCSVDIPSGVSLHPSTFIENITKTSNLESLFYKKVKTRKVNNIVLSTIYSDNF